MYSIKNILSFFMAKVVCVCVRIIRGYRCHIEHKVKSQEVTFDPRQKFTQTNCCSEISQISIPTLEKKKKFLGVLLQV